jgi:hypothetical protein
MKDLKALWEKYWEIALAAILALFVAIFLLPLLLR